MANRKTCPPCEVGQNNQCWKRWEGPASRGEGVGGSKPRQGSYTFLCSTEAAHRTDQS